jgi:hypothetical protein
MNKITSKERGNSNIRKKGTGKKGKRKGKSKYWILYVDSMQNRQTIQWTEEADKKLFELYKVKGSCWSIIANDFPRLTENQVKNRFYSTLRRLATKKAMSDPRGEQRPKTKKKDLVAFVDDAILYGHNCCSKRGRKRKLKPINTNIIKDVQEENILQDNNLSESKKVLSVHDEEEILKNDSVKDMDVEQINENMEVIKEEVGIIGEEYSKIFIEVNSNNIQEQVPKYGLMNSDYIQLLLTQNNGALNEFEVLARSQTMDTDLEELLQLERKMERCLQETQQIITPSETEVIS